MQNQLPFRPHDNNITTQMKYNLEAEHWERAFRSGRIRSTSFSFIEGSGIVGALITIGIALATIIVVAITWIVKSLIKVGEIRGKME